MASQTQGIQQLLQAEKRAADKVSLVPSKFLAPSTDLMYPNFWYQVNEARKRKARRLKQAKEEAQQDIEKYRQVKFFRYYVNEWTNTFII